MIFPPSQKNIIQKTLLSALIILLLSLFILIVTNYCYNKPFWNDEAFDIQMISKTGLFDLATGNTSHPNNNPLYYVLQKINLSFEYPADQSILISYRIVSILSGVAVISLLMLFLHHHFGLIPAIFAFFILINQKIFIHYTAESRHYMLWVFCFTLLVLTTSKLSVQILQSKKIKNLFFLLFSSILITLVVSMGFIQAFFALAGITILYCLRNSKKKKMILSSSAIFLVCFLLGLLFSLQKAGSFGNFYGSEWDLIENLKKGDYQLLKMPFRLIFPKPGRDGFLFFYVSNLLSLVGLVFPFYHWKRRHQLTETKQKMFAISYSVIFQFLAAIIIGCVIAFFHFYFVQKLFIYFTVCHVLLSVVGALWVWELAEENIKLSPSMKRNILFIFALLLTLLTWMWQKNNLTQQQRIMPSDAKCQMTSNKLPGHLQNPYPTMIAKLNDIVTLDQHIDQCQWFERLNAQRLYVGRNLQDSLYLSDQPIKNEAYRFMGKDLYFQR